MDGDFPPDRRTGRRGRRQRNSAKIPDGKLEGVSSDKENMKVRSSQLEGGLKEQVTFHGNVLADNSKLDLIGCASYYTVSSWILFCYKLSTFNDVTGKHFCTMILGQSEMTFA